MKRAHLHLVADNSPREAERLAPAAAAEIDFRALAVRARYWFAMLGLILGAPFRFLAAVGRICFATGLGFFVAIFRLFLGTIGIALIAIVGYGLLRVIFYPFFH
ncbi:MAG: hypothetical protein C0607_03550 [Azoarcus sp.]|nr:MAG: hypothetical protein C0607_03550 [Azoarcus sp.]TVT60032.1 MAG: hypothetical protein FHK80_03320 [Azoarcus sp. PHD]